MLYYTATCFQLIVSRIHPLYVVIFHFLCYMTFHSLYDYTMIYITIFLSPTFQLFSFFPLPLCTLLGILLYNLLNHVCQSIFRVELQAWRVYKKQRAFQSCANIHPLHYVLHKLEHRSFFIFPKPDQVATFQNFLNGSLSFQEKS